jgi:membrane-associated phospholipid phosphatase
MVRFPQISIYPKPNAWLARHGSGGTLVHFMEAVDPLQSAAGWLREAGSRIRTYWWIKMGGTIAFMAVFFAAYFYLLSHPRFPVTTVPRIFIDRWIPFQPGALPLYLSLWFYVCMAPAFLRTLREMRSYTIAATILSLAGFLVFIVWPTAVPKADVDPLLLPSLSQLKTVDASGNAFPSLHVAFAIFSALWFSRLFREMGTGVLMRAFNWMWCAGIIYSTMAIRQHVALDALSGAVLGAGVALVQQRLLDSKAKRVHS